MSDILFDEPIIRLADDMIAEAEDKSASDIHLETYATYSRIRYRIDGILYTSSELPTSTMERLIARLKVLAKLDITERRLPQDGRIPLAETGLDIRINACPTLWGEKLVLRLLRTQPQHLQLENLGMSTTQLDLFRQTITQAQGFILVTGPTGSGKSHTLYSALHYLNRQDKNISSIEDPVEIHLPGINQIPIHRKIGLDFRSALRSLLRQDPDIIMLGEIRDPESAAMAVQAALTGHLVFSSLHTNNAQETLTRLHTLGVPKADLVQANTCIIAQRLARQLCPYCKSPTQLPAHCLPGIAHEIPAFCAQSCALCLQGYRGRTGIYEFYTRTEQETLLEHAITKIQTGITSFTEIQRIMNLS